jgi:hypothetical protein
MNPEEIAAMIEIFQTLAPYVQTGIRDMITKLHHKTMTAEDFLALAATIVPQTE